jgi:hypothetical protein
MTNPRFVRGKDLFTERSVVRAAMTDVIANPWHLAMVPARRRRAQ